MTTSDVTQYVILAPPRLTHGGSWRDRCWLLIVQGPGAMLHHIPLSGCTDKADPPKERAEAVLAKWFPESPEPAWVERGATWRSEWVTQ